MRNTRILSHEREAAAKNSTGSDETLPICGNRGGLKEVNLRHTRGKGQKRGKKRGRRGRQGGNHNNTVRGVFPEESVAPVVNLLWPAKV